jgi:hypothetical protein
VISTLAIANSVDVVLPGDETDVDLLSSTIVLLSVEGVAWIVMRRRPGIGLVCCFKAVHCLGWFERRWKPCRASSCMFAQAGPDFSVLMNRRSLELSKLRSCVSMPSTES